MSIVVKSGTDTHNKSPFIEVTTIDPFEIVCGLSNEWWLKARETARNLFQDLAILVASDFECLEIMEMEAETAPNTPEGRERSQIIQRVILAASVIKPDSEVKERIKATLCSFCPIQILQEDSGNLNWNLVSNSVTALALLTKPHWAKGLRVAIADTFLRILGPDNLKASLTKLAEGVSLHPEVLEIANLCTSKVDTLTIPVTHLLGDLSPLFIPPRTLLQDEATKVLLEATKFFQSIPERLFDIQALLLDVKAQLKTPFDTDKVILSKSQSGDNWHNLISRYQDNFANVPNYTSIHRIVSQYVTTEEADRLSKQGCSVELVELLSGLINLFQSAEKLKAVESSCIETLRSLYKTHSGAEFIENTVFSDNKAFAYLSTLVIESETNPDYVDQNDEFKGEFVRRPSYNSVEGAFARVTDLAMLFENGHRIYKLLAEVSRRIEDPRFAEILPAENFLPVLIRMAQAHVAISKDNQSANGATKHFDWISSMLSSVIRHSKENPTLTEHVGFATPHANPRKEYLTQPIPVFAAGNNTSDNGIQYALKYFSTLKPEVLRLVADSFAEAVRDPETSDFNLEKKILPGVGTNNERDIARMVWLLAHTNEPKSATAIGTTLLWLSRYSDGLKEWLAKPEKIIGSIRTFVMHERTTKGVTEKEGKDEDIAALEKLNEVFSSLVHSTIKISSELQTKLASVYNESWRDEFRRILEDYQSNIKTSSHTHIVAPIYMDRQAALSGNLLPAHDTGAGFIVECRRLNKVAQSSNLNSADFFNIKNTLDGEKGERLLHTLPAPPLINEILHVVTPEISEEASYEIVAILSKIVTCTQKSNLHFHRQIGTTDDGILVPEQARYEESEGIRHTEGLSALMRKLRADMAEKSDSTAEKRVHLMTAALVDAADQKFAKEALDPQDVVPFDALLILLVAAKKTRDSGGDSSKVYYNINQLIEERNSYFRALKAMLSSSPAVLRAELQTMQSDFKAEELVRDVIVNIFKKGNVVLSAATEFKLLKIIAKNPYYHNILAEELERSSYITEDKKKIIQESIINKYAVSIAYTQEDIDRFSQRIFRDPEVSIDSSKYLNNREQFSENYVRYFSQIRLLMSDMKSHPGRGQVLLRKLDSVSSGLRSRKPYQRHEIKAYLKEITGQYQDFSEQKVNDFPSVVDFCMPEAATLLALSLLDAAMSNMHRDSTLTGDIRTELTEWSALIPKTIRVKKDQTGENLIVSLSPAETIVNVLLHPSVSPCVHDRALHLAPEIFCINKVLAGLLDPNLSDEQLKLNLAGVLTAYSNNSVSANLASLTSNLANLMVSEPRIKNMLIQLLSPSPEGGISINNLISDYFNELPGAKNPYAYSTRISHLMQVSTGGESVPLEHQNYSTDMLRHLKSTLTKNFISSAVSLVAKDLATTSKNSQAAQSMLNLLETLPTSRPLERALVNQLCQGRERKEIAAWIIRSKIAFHVPEWIEDGYRVLYISLIQSANSVVK